MEACKYTPHYTVEDYNRWDGDWELWYGTAVAMPPSPRLTHQVVAANFAMLLKRQIDENDECHCLVAHETDWHIAHDVIVRPDVFGLCEPNPDDFITRPPTVIVEVLSPSTAEKDRTAKRILYAEQGVAFYLLADPDEQTIEVLRLVDGRYEDIIAQADGFSMQLHEGCSVTINPSDVWRSLNANQ